MPTSGRLGLRVLMCFAVTVLVWAESSTQGARAGDVDNNNNFSASWYRTVNRNAATDSADVVAYNPGGVTLLQDGLYINLSNQFVTRDYAHTLPTPEGDVRFKAINPTYLFPSAYAVFKRDNWAVFGAFTVPGGGGELQYDDGVYTTYGSKGVLGGVNPASTGFAAYYAGTLGGAYRPLEWLSFSLAARLIVGRGWAISEAKGDTIFKNDAGETIGEGDKLLDMERSAFGVSGIVGIDFIPIPELVIGLRYEHQTALEWTVDKLFDPTGKGALEYAEEGEKYRRDLPGIIGLGVSYDVWAGLRTEASFSMYLNPLANWDGDEDDHDLGWETGLAVEYSFDDLTKWMNVLGLSSGFLYASNGAGPDSYWVLKPALDHVIWGGGVFAEFWDRLRVDLGVTKVFYFEDELTREGQEPIELDKDALSFAIQAEVRFL